MDLLQLYYYAGTPILACNLLFYSLTTLSNSISSSQNVFKFISEHVEPDYIVFKNTVEYLDLENKLNILHLFIFDVLKKYCKTEEQYNELVCLLRDDDENKTEEYIIIKNKNNILCDMPEALKTSLITLCEIIFTLLNLINTIHQKISVYRNSYIKSLIKLQLKSEINRLNNMSKILDIRSKLFFDLTNIYLTKI